MVKSTEVRPQNDIFKAWMVKDATFVGKYELPELRASNAKPIKAIPFDKALKSTTKNKWIHFYIDDRKFECVWNNPKAYLNCLKQFDGIISTDFSLYRDMPLSMQIWNTYRNRALAYWMQYNGVTLIPNVQWADERSYDFCFDGIPKHNTVAISTNGCIKDKIDRYYFKKGLAELVKRLCPKVIVNYSYTPDDIFSYYIKSGIEIIQLPNYNDVVRGRVQV